MSAAIDTSRLLRPGLLDGVSLLVAAAPELTHEKAARPADAEDSFACAIAAACAELGARASAWKPEDSVDRGVDMLVVDAAGAFALPGVDADGANVAGGPARDALRVCLDGAWEATRTVANAAFIEPGRPGRIVYLAPPCAVAPGRSPAALPTEPAPADAYADAARAGLENLARTLSIEWARYAITLVTIAPSERTTAAEVAALTAYLGSAAGAYFSGCLLDLRGSGAVET